MSVLLEGVNSDLVRFSVFKRSRILLAAFSVVVHVESLLCILLGLAETMRNDDVIFTRIRLVIRWRLVVITCGLLLLCCCCVNEMKSRHQTEFGPVSDIWAMKLRSPF